MTRALTRTNLHNSRLIRVLTDLAVLDAGEPGGAFAEKLGHWLDLNDAITLCAVHNASAAIASVWPSDAKPAAIGDEFSRVRDSVVDSITKGSLPKGGRTRIELPSPKPGVPLEVATAFEPYRRYYLAHQRHMASNVSPLRLRAREVLGQTSPALKTLAALDAVLDGILGEREDKLLAKLPLLLEQRFQHLLKAHQHLLEHTQQPENPGLWMKPGGWLARFCHELQTVLLAELDVRLQPTFGLIEAFNNEKTKIHE